VFPQPFGKYVLERELSRGGMARLLLATLRGAGGFEKKLVVKQIRDELCFDRNWVERFVEEAKTTVALSHPNIVPVYELGVEQGTYFLAMELVEGVTVHELLKGGEGKRRRLTPEQGAYIGVEVCRALDYAHRRMQVVHRDITPRNVMVDEEGQIKVIDFGIAAPLRVAGHEVFGSPGHMPPEQVDGGELGPPTDIFAVAVLLMEAWSGTPPFRRATAEESDAAMRAPHPKPSEVDPRLLPLDEVILRAMSLDPKERPHDAEELGRALRKFLVGLDTADIARDLGAHVRAARKALAKKRMKGPGNEWKPSQPSHGAMDIHTKTFAAREEVRDWKSEAPPPLDAKPATAPTSGSDAPSTRQMADPDVPADAPSTRQMPPSDPPPSGKLETVATRPLETPVDAPSPPSAVPGAKRTRRWVPIGAAMLLAAAAIAVVRVQARVPGPSGNPPSATASGGAPTAGPTPTPVPTPTLSASPSPVLTATATPTSTTNPSPNPSGTGAVAPAASAPVGKAHVALFGDPGTRVSVDGTPRGTVPVRDLALEPGTHDVLFTFDQTGERRGDRITLQPGEHLRLRADFTGAVPTIRIDR
jgi:serine/threonine-protein kinase